MIVQNFKTSHAYGRKRVSADVIWETAARPKEEIYFEVDEEYAEDISCNPDAFFLATVIPALYYGEKKYTINNRISPMLYQGVRDALGWLQSWYYSEKKRDSIKFEIELKDEIEPQKESRSSACFLSGGIDSYATLFDNRKIYPKGHPGYIKDVIVAFGLEQTDPKKFEYVLSMLRKAERKLDLSLIPVYTSIYSNYREEDAINKFYLWKYEFQGAALASIAHILSNRIEMISIGATFDLINIGPFGSHPLLDPNFSSEKLKVRHDGLIYSRFEKTKLAVENYPSPIDLRVCNYFKKYSPNNFNCGQCEKCVRTMLAFLILGKLNGLDAFPHNNVTKDLVIQKSKIKDDYGASCYRELIEPLKKIGRNDLVNAVQHVLKRYHKKNNSMRYKLSEIDKKYFNGFIRKFLK